MQPVRHARWQVWALCGALCSPLAGRAGEAPRRPRASVVVQALDASAERDAIRIYRLLSNELQQSRAFALAAPEAVVDGVPPADDPAVQAGALFTQGKRAFDTIEIAQAAQLLGRAADLLEAAPGRLDVDLYHRVLSYLGSSLLLLDRREAGRDAFRRLLLGAPRAALDPVVFPPHLAAAFKEVAAEVQRLPLGSVRVETPRGAEVYVDGAWRGFAPGKVEGLRAGPHIVQLRRLGYRPFGARVEVPAGAEARLVAELDADPGGGARLRDLVRRLGDVAPESVYPRVVDELLGWLGSEHLFFLRVSGAAPRLRVQAFCYDGSAHLGRAPVEEAFDPQAPDFAERLARFFVGMAQERGELTAAGGPEEVAAPAGVILVDEAAQGEAKEEDSVWSSWWLWTCLGVLVAGGVAVGLALGLTDEPAPTHAEVQFSF